MTAELAAYAAEDAETLLVAWMTPLRRSSSVRAAGDPLPFTLITHITGPENPDESTAEPVVSVHTLCDKALGVATARDECLDTHRRMLLLSQTPQAIAIGARTVSVDYINVLESPRWEFYSDQILRKVGRYQVGLTYVAL